MTANQESSQSGAHRDGAIADEARPRKPNTWLVVSLAFALTAVMAVDAYLIRHIPKPLPPAAQEMDLRWAVADVVKEIEAFRQGEGRLPTAADLEGLLNEVISYQTDGSEYRVTAIQGTLRVEYDGSVPLETWMAQRGMAPQEHGS